MRRQREQKRQVDRLLEVATVVAAHQPTLSHSVSTGSIRISADSENSPKSPALISLLEVSQVRVAAPPRARSLKRVLEGPNPDPPRKPFHWVVERAALALRLVPSHSEADLAEVNSDRVHLVEQASLETLDKAAELDPSQPRLIMVVLVDPMRVPNLVVDHMQAVALALEAPVLGAKPEPDLSLLVEDTALVEASVMVVRNPVVMLGPERNLLPAVGMDLQVVTVVVLMLEVVQVLDRKARPLGVDIL